LNKPSLEAMDQAVLCPTQEQKTKESATKTESIDLKSFVFSVLINNASYKSKKVYFLLNMRTITNPGAYLWIQLTGRPS